MGGGVSVGAHKNGKVIDVNNTLDGDGPFSPERSGGVPAGALVKCVSPVSTHRLKYIKRSTGKAVSTDTLEPTTCATLQNVPLKRVTKKQPVYSTHSLTRLPKKSAPWQPYLTAKVDQILLTGGIAYSDYVTSEIKEKVGFIAPITVYPGEDELLALAQGALRVLNGEEKPLVY